MRAATVEVLMRVVGAMARGLYIAPNGASSGRAVLTSRAMLTPLSRPTPARILTLLALAELLGMSPWFAASAVGPQLAARWSLSAEQTASLTSIVQLGFVAGTALVAIFNLADVIAARFLFAACALGA